MRTSSQSALLSLLIPSALAAGLMLGCEGASPREEARPKGKTEDKDKAAAAKAESKKALVGKNVFLEVLPDKKRRVLVSAEVCLREGQLEQFLCRKQTKEHEAILTADVDARHIHEALIYAGAEEGSPVRFAPKYRPASGTTIKVSVKYKDKDKDKLVTVPAQSWIKNAKDNKSLQSDWVFAGSHLVNNPLDPDKKHYLANDGEVICVSNFETALLDLPIESPKDNADLIFVANSERIPPLGTKVVVVLEPVLEEKK
ncbi:MAG: YdjY domain-containing protein [Gemmataceae bacterium]